MIYLAILARGQELQGGRMFGFGPMFGDPNDLALNFCMVLPFCVGFLLSTRWFWKVVWATGIGILVATIFATYSRGGFLALVAIFVAMVREFKLRTRTVALVVVLVVGVSAVAILRVGADSYFDRLRTIANPQADVTGSAQARQRLLIRSVEETLRHPLLGVGPGVFYTLSGDWHQSHNTFLQLTSECGIPSLILFLMLTRRAFKNSKILGPSERRDEVWYYAAGLRSAMVGYLVGGFFLGTAYWLQPYLLFAYSVALRRIDAHSSERTEELHAEKAQPRPVSRIAGRPASPSGYRGRHF
jgi:O-antigen ligase